jgi:Fe-Mn family superoxide dismutase
METNRRDFIKKGTLLALAGVAGSQLAKSIGKVNDIIDKEQQQTATPFTLPPLPYGYDALEPYIDKMTMEIHHDKHHKAYVDNLNKALAGAPAGTKFALEEMFQTISEQPIAIRNNGGGHYNHSLFWQLMKPKGGGAPTGKLSEAIIKSYGSFENFQKKFNEMALSRFGSGWTWLIIDTSVLNNTGLSICSTPNQDNPLMSTSEIKGKPVLALDVWEHAYYLKYQNKRVDYINSWWNVVNWEKANELFTNASK